MTFLLSRFEGQIPVGSVVANETEVSGSVPAIIGSLLILNTMILGFSFPGPWDSESFTLGIIGIYLARIFEQTKGRDQYVIKDIKDYE